MLIINRFQVYFKTFPALFPGPLVVNRVPFFLWPYFGSKHSISFSLSLQIKHFLKTLKTLEQSVNIFKGRFPNSFQNSAFNFQVLEGWTTDYFIDFTKLNIKIKKFKAVPNSFSKLFQLLTAVSREET